MAHLFRHMCYGFIKSELSSAAESHRILVEVYGEQENGICITTTAPDPLKSVPNAKGVAQSTT